MPVETVAAPTKGYKSGGTYGPVMPGERLGKIALKVRPDPSISSEQMMQALFKANPQAFAKSGINELKVGSTLRLPTLRQIAKFSGSAAARSLAEAEEAQTAALVQGGKPPLDVSVTKSNGIGLADASAGAPQAFALAPPDVLEPMMTEAAPSLSALLGPSKSGLEAADKYELPGRSPSAKRATVTQPTSSVGNVAPPILTPVSATPLMYLAVAEVIGAAVKIPGSVIPAQIAPGSIIADASLTSARRIPKLGTMPITFTAKSVTTAGNGSGARTIGPVVANKSVRLPSSVPSPSYSVSTTNLLGVLEGRVGEFTARLDTTSGVTAPATTQSDKVAKAKAEPTYKGGEQYGPVGANERLWDIATKVRPDAEIGKDVMMKALFLANPQAFSGREIDHMKEGALLRVPTLEEIVKYTGSPAAKELLERQVGSVTSAEVKQETGAQSNRQEDTKLAVKPTQSPTPTPTPTPATNAQPVGATPSTTVAPSTGEVTAPSSADAEKKAKAEPTYKGGEQYGPVGANERLWDIATKVRPDAEIGKDVMMKALFLANPQAFSGREIDHMKEGALLRVPTLEEIVKYTGSPAAKELLEKGRNDTAQSVDPPAPVSNR